MKFVEKICNDALCGVVFIFVMSVALVEAVYETFKKQITNIYYLYAKKDMRIISYPSYSLKLREEKK